jgi:uncharacterized tellurite resistance protein B-like protein
VLSAIRTFFDRHIRPVGDTAAVEAKRQHRLQVATAALLIEMMRMDAEIEEVERQAVVRAIREKFGLMREEIDTLLELAEAEAKRATDYYQFTALINREFTPEQKERLVELMWQVAYADGAIDKYEDHFVRKIADLLYVPHSAFIAAKHRARAAHEGRKG